MAEKLSDRSTQIVADDGFMVMKMSYVTSQSEQMLPCFRLIPPAVVNKLFRLTFLLTKAGHLTFDVFINENCAFGLTFLLASLRYWQKMPDVFS